MKGDNMNDILVFHYKSSEVRTVELNGEPWFVLKDVCAVLGISNHKMTAQRLDADEVSLTDLTDSMGRQQETTVINESGLYNVILRSDKPEAKPFRKWVTSEVLPSIRKTGSYTMPKLSKEMQALFLLDDRTQKQEARITALENTMTVDYSQQQTLKKAVGRVVVEALGGKSAPAYNDPHVRGKLFSECNRDVQDWFRVNSVCNVPRKDFTQAVEYIQRWKPSTNSVMLIQQTNAQTSLYE
jgi:prophage antirepressor-like protein